MENFPDIPPVEGDTPPIEDSDPVEGDTPPAEDNDAEGGTPPIEDSDPVEGDTPPAEDGNVEGDTPPAEDSDAEGDTPPAEDSDAEGDTPPVTGDEMQGILDSLRETLNDKDADVAALTDSVRTLVDAMNVEPLSVADLPFDGWRDWWYPVKMDYSVYPKGAGRWMDASELFDTPEALLGRYNELLGLCHTSGTLNDFYVRYIWAEMDSDGEEYIVYDYEAVKEPVTEITVPFEGYENWNYPVTMDFTVHPWGAGYDMEQTETIDTAEAFKSRYSEILELCKDGGTLKDFYVRYIRDSGGNTVYAYQTEDPEEDLTPAMLETLQTMDARLASMDAALAGIASVSQNSITYYEDGLKLYRQANELLTHTLAVDLALLFVLVLMSGHRIAHAFWQRMKVG